MCMCKYGVFAWSICILGDVWENIFLLPFCLHMLHTRSERRELLSVRPLTITTNCRSLVLPAGIIPRWKLIKGCQHLSIPSNWFIDLFLLCQYIRAQSVTFLSYQVIVKTLLHTLRNIHETSTCSGLCCWHFHSLFECLLWEWIAVRIINQLQI